ncbi:MAG TPA: response regulator [Terricaulis sp.]|nr:response regulator [Terricaulis sp.]
MRGETRILVVEDDPSLRRSLAATLEAAGYRGFEAGSVAEAQRALAHHKPHLILLDLGLPDADGLEFIVALRREALTPVVVLSARGAEAMKVAALDAGADDYVTKPFGVDELLARIRAGFRHGLQTKGAAPVVRTGDLEIDLAAHIVRRAGAEVALSPKEFEILAVLAERLGAVVRHKELLKAVWGSERADIQYLRVYLGQLRAKLEPDPANPRYLLSDQGVGYRLFLHDPR